MMPTSTHERMLKAYQAGPTTYKGIVVRSRMAERTVEKWARHLEDTGQIERIGNCRRPLTHKLTEHGAEVLKRVAIVHPKVETTVQYAKRTVCTSVFHLGA